MVNSWPFIHIETFRAILANDIGNFKGPNNQSYNATENEDWRDKDQLRFICPVKFHDATIQIRHENVSPGSIQVKLGLSKPEPPSVYCEPQNSTLISP